MAALSLLIVTGIIVPVTMLAVGIWFTSSAPEYNSDLTGVGYKSKLSMKNNDTWAAAHRINGRLMLIMGIISLLMAMGTFLYELFTVSGDENRVYIIMIVLISVQTAMLMLTLPLTEKRLKKLFTPDGKRR